MEKPAAGWFLHWSSATGVDEYTWGNFCEHALKHFESSNYQASLRAKLQRLKQTADIESYNGDYSALIFRAEGMSELDQVLNYANGLRQGTRSYAKLRNPAKLSEAMDLAVKYEVTHYVEEARTRQVHLDNKKASTGQEANQGGRNNGKPFRGKGRFKPSAKPKGGKETCTCFYLNEGPAVVKRVTGALTLENISINVLSENPLVYKSRPLFSVGGEISVGNKSFTTPTMLLDSGAIAVYVSKHWVEKNQLSTTKFSEKSIRVKLGDNQVVEAELELLALFIKIQGLEEAYDCVAVVYAIPDEFDCILGVPFFEDVQPMIGWSGRRIEGTRTKILQVEQASKTSGPIEEGGQVIASGLRRSAGAKGLSAKRPDSCRGAALETDVRSTVELAGETEQKDTPRVACGQLDRESAERDSAERSDTRSSSDKGTVEKSSAGGNNSVVEKMFTMGVVDAAGVETKYITRKKLRKFLRIKTKTPDEPDFMLVLSNDTIKRVASSLQRHDQPDNVGSAKAQRYLDTDWESFRANPAYELLKEYKDTVFRPELPEGLPEKREIEHRIDVRDPNVAIRIEQKT
ncbi:Pol Polyprotein [Phytophthora cinnamomi]|uniref:Pol Polyprotein n=1 Tax=Phytophthora cinnamomi TaxID=4785 RepID=UPI0035596BAD|nr:Pol Polyprotein [Phytophthora cinnamomi]